MTEREAAATVAAIVIQTSILATIWTVVGYRARRESRRWWVAQIAGLLALATVVFGSTMLLTGGLR